MSDISFHFEWWHLPLIAIYLGWPGLLVGAVIGALVWKQRRILGGVLGAIAGTAAWVAAVYYLKMGV